MAVQGMVALHMVEANYQLPAQACHILTNSRLSTICQRRFFLNFFLLYASERRSTISHLPSVYVPLGAHGDAKKEDERGSAGGGRSVGREERRKLLLCRRRVERVRPVAVGAVAVVVGGVIKTPSRPASR